MTIPIYNVPFCSNGKCIVEMVVIKKNDKTLILEMDIQLTNVPKSDLFKCKEAWIIIDISPKNNPEESINFNRCLFQKLMKVEFKESSMF